MLDKRYREGIVNVDGHHLAIFEAQQQTLTPSWSSHNFDVPASVTVQQAGATLCLLRDASICMSLTGTC